MCAVFVILVHREMHRSSFSFDESRAFEGECIDSTGSCLEYESWSGFGCTLLLVSSSIGSLPECDGFADILVIGALIRFDKTGTRYPAAIAAMISGLDRSAF